MSREGTPTDNPIIEALNGWMKEELYLDFRLANTDDVLLLLDQSSITGDLRLPWAIKVQLSIRPSRASNAMVVFSVYFFLTDAQSGWLIFRVHSFLC